MTQAVTALGYVGIGASDLDAWQRYATEVLGLACEEADGALELRMDAAPWRLRVERSDSDDIAYAGFELDSPKSLVALGRHLQSMDIAVVEGTVAERTERGVARLLRCEDPDGIVVELYCGRTEAATPFVSPRGIEFVTGEQGLGHIVLMVSDGAASTRFYVDGLGFRVSDYITLGKPPRSVDVTFLHCNPRHHTVALAPAPGAPKRLNHVMLQVPGLDDVGATLDLIRDRELPLAQGLGRHTNDHMVSFYAVTPSGFQVEFGTGARTVDDATWTVAHYDTGSSWGHRREAGGRNA
ncbi:MAG: VOC family protein [Pseudomonadales bacterium]